MCRVGEIRLSKKLMWGLATKRALLVQSAVKAVLQQWRLVRSPHRNKPKQLFVVAKQTWSHWLGACYTTRVGHGMQQKLWALKKNWEAHPAIQSPSGRDAAAAASELARMPPGPVGS